MLFKIVSKTRSAVMRTLLPSASYYFTGRATRSTQPLSTKYGYDRGGPIDRVYIEDFMAKNADLVKGKCLEIVENKYTVQFGCQKVAHSEILDIRTENKNATVYGDLKNLKNIEDNVYDCLIVTQTFGQIDEPILAAKECYRILKPGGVLLATFSCLGKVEFEEYQFWRFSKASAKFVFGKAFGVENLEINTYGNSLVCQAFLAGFSAQDLTEEEVQTNDKEYPLIVTLKAVKK